VQPGQAIVNLEAMDSLKADFRIPEVYVGQIKTGQETVVRVDAFPGREFRGRIYAIDPRIDEASRTILLRARIPNGRGELRPGMFVRVTLVLGERPDALWVPEQAIVPMGNGKFVYRIADGKAVLTPVTIGDRREGRVEIAEGVGPADTVVVGGQTKLFDGMPVAPIGAAKPETSGAPAAPSSAAPAAARP